jgi:chemotaxis protein methyltransferase CheR
MVAASERYRESGGRKNLSDYYVSAHGNAALDPRLREHVVFSDHNLAGDAAFGQMNLIVCRNVLMYFGPGLQERVIGLFLQSLVTGGFLCIGTKESLHGHAVASSFEAISLRERIYRRRIS